MKIPKRLINALDQKDFEAFPKENTKHPRMAEKYRCVCCNKYYFTADKHWTVTDLGTYCNLCVESGRYKTELPPVTIVINSLPNIEI